MRFRRGFSSPIPANQYHQFERLFEESYAAIAANDKATIATTKAELARPLWYTHFAPSSADDVRAIHAEARLGHTARLEQTYEINCRDITGEP